MQLKDKSNVLNFKPPRLKVVQLKYYCYFIHCSFVLYNNRTELRLYESHLFRTKFWLLPD